MWPVLAFFGVCHYWAHTHHGPLFNTLLVSFLLSLLFSTSHLTTLIACIALGSSVYRHCSMASSVDAFTPSLCRRVWPSERSLIDSSVEIELCVIVLQKEETEYA